MPTYTVHEYEKGRFEVRMMGRDGAWAVETEAQALAMARLMNEEESIEYYRQRYGAIKMDSKEDAERMVEFMTEHQEPKHTEAYMIFAERHIFPLRIDEAVECFRSVLADNQPADPDPDPEDATGYR